MRVNASLPARAAQHMKAVPRGSYSAPMRQFSYFASQNVAAHQLEAVGDSVRSANTSPEDARFSLSRARALLESASQYTCDWTPDQQTSPDALRRCAEQERHMYICCLASDGVVSQSCTVN